MGIKGLLAALKPLQKVVHLCTFRGQTVAIDASGWLHRASYGCAMELALNFPTDRYLIALSNLLRLVLEAGIKPIVVFDGAAPPLKGDESSRRHEVRQEAIKRGMASLSEDMDVVRATEHFQRAVRIDSFMVKQFQSLLTSHSVPFIVAPYEADAQIALLYSKKMVTAAISEDSDLLALGCRKLITKLDKSGEATLVDIDIQTLALFLPKKLVRLPTIEEWEKARNGHIGWCITGEDATAPKDIVSKKSPIFATSAGFAPIKSSASFSEGLPSKVTVGGDSSIHNTPKRSLSSQSNFTQSITSSPIGSLVEGLTNHEKAIDSFEVLLQRRKVRSPTTPQPSPNIDLGEVTGGEVGKQLLRSTLITSFFSKVVDSTPDHSKSIDREKEEKNVVDPIIVDSLEDISDDDITSFGQTQVKTSTTSQLSLTESASLLDDVVWDCQVDSVLNDVSSPSKSELSTVSLLDCKLSYSELFKKFGEMQREESKSSRNMTLADSNSNLKTVISPLNGQPLSQADYEFILTVACLSPPQFLELSILAGCDYLPSLPRVGLKTAAKLFRKSFCADCCVHQLVLQSSKGKISSPILSPGCVSPPLESPVSSQLGYHALFHRTRLAMWHQVVFDPEEKRFTYLSPPPSSLAARFPQSLSCVPGAYLAGRQYPSDCLVAYSTAIELYTNALKEIGVDPAQDQRLEHLRMIKNKNYFDPLPPLKPSQRQTIDGDKLLSRVFRNALHSHDDRFGLLDSYGEIGSFSLQELAIQALEHEGIANDFRCQLDLCFAGLPLPDELAVDIASGHVSPRDLRVLLSVEDEFQDLLQLFRKSLLEHGSFIADAVRQMSDLNMCTPALLNASYDILNLPNSRPQKGQSGIHSSVQPLSSYLNSESLISSIGFATPIKQDPDSFVYQGQPIRQSIHEFRSSRQDEKSLIEKQREFANDVIMTQSHLHEMEDTLMRVIKSVTTSSTSSQSTPAADVKSGDRKDSSQLSQDEIQLEIHQSKPCTEMRIELLALDKSCLVPKDEIDPWVYLLTDLAGLKELNDAQGMEDAELMPTDLGHKRKSIQVMSNFDALNVKHDEDISEKKGSFIASLVKGFSSNEAQTERKERHDTILDESTRYSTVSQFRNSSTTTTLSTSSIKLASASGLAGVQTTLNLQTGSKMIMHASDSDGTQKRRLTSSLKSSLSSSSERDTADDLFESYSDIKTSRSRASKLTPKTSSDGAFISVDNPYASMSSLFDSPHVKKPT